MILTKENITAVNIKEQINGKVKAGRLNELLVIVPTNRKARNLKKELISQVPLKASYRINIETLTTISTKLLQQLKPFKLLSEAAATVFIKQCSNEIDLKYFSLYKNEIPFGTLDRIKSVISEYKRQGITTAILRRETELLDGSEKFKALDIAGIYEKFLSKCYALNAYETGDVYTHLNSFELTEFVNTFRKIYSEVDLIVADGFAEFSNPEIEILEKITCVPKTKLFLRFDYDADNKLLFSHLDKYYDRLSRLGFVKIEDGDRNNFGNFKNILREKLFKTKGLSGKINFTDRITTISAHDREKEIETIAREIKKLIINEKIEPHKICVVFNLVQNYSDTIKDIFEKNGIPFNLSDRTPLDNSNPVTAIVNFLEIIENNFYFKNIFRALSSGFVDVHRINVANLYLVSSELKIVSGKENWINTLKDAISNFDLANGSDENNNFTLTAYTKALSDIKSLAKMLRPFEEKLTIAEFNERLKDFIVDSKLPFKMLETEIKQENNIRAFTDFLEITEEIFNLLEKEEEEEKHSLGFFMDQIRTACNWARFNVKEKSNYGVQVTSLDEIRGLSFDYLFIGDLCDGDLPTRFKPEIFFSGSFKKQASIHQTEERYRFYQSLCAWNKKLYLTFPLTESGRETIISTFLKDLEEVFAVSSKNETDYEDAIYSLEEMQTLIGKNELNEAETFLTDEMKIDLQKISQAIEVDKLRCNNPFAESQYTGHLVDTKTGETEDVSERLKAFSSRQYSISQLETYAKCPFKFFAERVLGIETIEEPTEDIEAIEMGRLLHSILYTFYSVLRDKNIKLTGCGDAEFKNAEKLIFEIAEKELETTAFKSPLTFYEKEKILGINGDKKESILYRFLQTEKNNDDFLPMFFEVSFGRLRESESDKILSVSEPIRIDGIKLRGKIDRIEVNEKLKSFNVVDYKLSGAKPTFDDLKNGISLQLPIYLFAASKLLSEKLGGEYSPNEMFIYSLKYAIDDFGKKPLKTKGGKDDIIQSIEQIVENSIEHVKNYINSIADGRFHISKLEDRENKVCRFCMFRTICRVDEVRE